MDIERVTPNMRAEIKFSGFNAKEIPVVFGTVHEISPDRLIEEQSGMPYFLVRILVTDENIPPQLQGRLMPGMPGGVVIPTGERTVMQYLIDPMQNAFRYALRER
jgi:epimerase transport system membrane fusion protein